MKARTLNENTPFVNRLSVVIGDTTKTETGTRKANKRLVFIGTQNTDTSVSETASAFIMEESKRVVYRALKTVYQKSADKTILSLMRECSELLNDNTAEREEYITRTSGNVMMKAKKHTRQKDIRLNKFFSCRPFTTFHYTETGKRMHESIELNKNLDVFDLINTAYLAYLELVNIGAIIDYRDIKRNRGYAYKCIRSEIYANKKASSEQELYSRYCVITDDDGNETVYTGKHIDTNIRVDYDATLAIILDCVRSVSAKQAKVENAVRAFEMFANGYSRTEIAECMEVNEKQVRRYIELVRRIADNAETRKRLSEII